LKVLYGMAQPDSRLARSSMTAGRGGWLRAWTPRTLRTKSMIIVAVPVVALLIAIAGIFLAGRASDRAADHAGTALETQAVLGRILILTLDATSGTNAYLATGEPRFLQSAERAVRLLPTARADLSDLLPRDGPQRQLLAQLDAALTEQSMALTTILAGRGSIGVRTDRLLADETRTETVRSLLADLQNQEEARLRVRETAASRLHNVVTITSVGAAGLGLIGGLAAMLALSGGVAKRVRLVQDNVRRLAEAEPLHPMPGRVMERTAGVMADNRALMELTLETGRLVLFELHPDRAVHFRGDPHLLSDLGFSGSDTVEDVGSLQHRLGLGELGRQLARGGSGGVTSPSRIDLTVPTVDGHRLSLEVRWCIVRGNGGKRTGMVVGVVTDVSEQLRARLAVVAAMDAALRANLAKTEFLSRMSHELRTPLNAVLGFAQLLAMDRLDQEQRDNVDHIQRGGRQLLALINDVLDLARVESGSLALSIEPIEVSAVVSDAIRLMRPIAADQLVTVRLDPDRTPNLYASANHQRLEQIVINLVSNAIKYNHPGGSVTIGWHRGGPSEVLITVRDTCGGIATDVQAKLFAPFERLGAERGRIEGTGLGLAISHQLSQAMGGSLALEETGPEGSVFVVSLPAAKPRDVAHEPAGAAEAVPDLLDIKVLTIDDNLANLALVTQLLRRAHAPDPLKAVQGRLGLQLASIHQPDLILLDRHLPDMRGDELLDRLRTDPRTAGIPVIVISADVMPEHISAMKKAGAAAFLAKPIDVEAFWAAIRLALDEKGRKHDETSAPAAR
jgi:signal transduction histidine kinase/CHASE3 domain sensor protein/ActR/RegA family two-component response regulator